MFRPFVLLLLAGILFGDPTATRSGAAAEDGPGLVSVPGELPQWVAAPGVEPLQARLGREGGTPVVLPSLRTGRSADLAFPAGPVDAPPTFGTGAHRSHLIHCGVASWCTATPPPHVPR